MKFYKQLRKRGLAMFMALVMCLSLLPATAMAEDAGTTDSLHPTSDSDDNVTISKSAARSETPGTWTTTMTVEPQITIQTKPLELVLVLDTSVSMDWCTHIHTAECGQITTTSKKINGQLIRTTTGANCGHTHLDGDGHLVDKTQVDWYKYDCNKDPDEQNTWCTHEHTKSCVQETVSDGRVHYSCGHHHESSSANKAPAGSLCESRWLSAKSAMITLLGQLNGLQRDVSVAVVGFDGSEHEIYVQSGKVANLNSNYDAIIKSIQNHDALHSGTKPSIGLTAANGMFTNKSSDKVVILLSDGKPDSGDGYVEAANTLKNGTKAEIFTIGFTVDSDALKNIASENGANGHYMTAESAKDLIQVFDKIATMLSPMIQDNVGTKVTVDVDTAKQGEGVTATKTDLSWTPVGGKIEVQPGNTPSAKQTISYPVELDISKMNVGENKGVALNGEATLEYYLDGNTSKNTLKFGIPTDTVYIAQLTTSYAVTDAEGKTVESGVKDLVKKGIVQWSASNKDTTFKDEDTDPAGSAKINPPETIKAGNKTYYYVGSKLDGTAWSGSEVTTDKAEAHTLVHSYSEKAFKITKAAEIVAPNNEDRAGVAKVGDKIKYTITVTNLTDAPLTDITVNDTLVKKLGVGTNGVTVAEQSAGTWDATAKAFTIANLAGKPATATIEYEYVVKAGDKATNIFNVATSEDPGSTTRPEDPKDPPEDPDPTKDNVTKTEVEKLKIVKVEKALKLDTDGKPVGLEESEYVIKDGKVQVLIPEGTSTVTLTYTITVTGDAGAEYSVTDEGAVLTSTGDTENGPTQDQTTKKITGKIPGEKGKENQHVEITVTKTFGANAGNNVTAITTKADGTKWFVNTATVESGNPETTDGPDTPDPNDPDDPDGPGTSTVETPAKDPENPKLTTIRKEVVRSEVEGITPPQGVTFTYPAENETIKVDENGVTLLYRITVTGTEGAAYTVKDTGATFISKDGTTTQTEVTDTLGAPAEGEAVSTATYYAYRTFQQSDIGVYGTSDWGKIVNMVELTPGEDTDIEPENPEDPAPEKLTDEEKTPAEAKEYEYKLVYLRNYGPDPEKQDVYTAVTSGKTTASAYSDFKVGSGSIARDGYIFKGWAKDATGTQMVKAGDPISVTRDAPIAYLYAQWEKLCTVTVVYMDDQGNLVEIPMDGKYVSSRLVGDQFKNGDAYLDEVNKLVPKTFEAANGDHYMLDPEVTKWPVTVEKAGSVRPYDKDVINGNDLVVTVVYTLDNWDKQNPEDPDPTPDHPGTGDKTPDKYQVKVIYKVDGTGTSADGYIDSNKLKKTEIITIGTATDPKSQGDVKISGATGVPVSGKKFNVWTQALERNGSTSTPSVLTGTGAYEKTIPNGTEIKDAYGLDVYTFTASFKDLGTYDVTYKFVFVDENGNRIPGTTATPLLANAVKEYLPEDQIGLLETMSTPELPTDPANGKFVVVRDKDYNDKGTLVFQSWVQTPKENPNQKDVEYVGTWVYTAWPELNMTKYELIYLYNRGSADSKNDIWNQSGVVNSPSDSEDFTVMSGEPTREGYIFKGWTGTATGETKYAAGDTVTATRDYPVKYLYAQWEKIPTYTVTYRWEGSVPAGVNPPEDHTAYHSGDAFNAQQPNRTQVPIYYGSVLIGMWGFDGWKAVPETITKNETIVGTWRYVPTSIPGPLTVTKTPDKTVANVGDPITWTVTVTNGTTSTYTGLSLVDILEGAGNPEGAEVGYGFYANPGYTVPEEPVRNVYTLTIYYRYETEDGLMAAPAYTAVLEAGAPYSVPSPVIEGYTADQEVVTGNMPAATEMVNGGAKITVIYTANPPVEPEVPETSDPTESGKEDPDASTSKDSESGMGSENDEISEGTDGSEIIQASMEYSAGVEFNVDPSNFTLAPGAVVVFEVTYTVKAGDGNADSNLVNHVTVTEPDNPEPVGKGDSDPVKVLHPDLKVVKTRTSAETARIGDIITWDITITNNGDGTAYDVNVTDADAALSQTHFASIPAKESVKVTATHVVTGNETLDDDGKFVNTAIVTYKENPKDDPENPEEPKKTEGSDDGTVITYRYRIDHVYYTNGTNPVTDPGTELPINHALTREDSIVTGAQRQYTYGGNLYVAYGSTDFSLVDGVYVITLSYNLTVVPPPQDPIIIPPTFDFTGGGTPGGTTITDNDVPLAAPGLNSTDHFDYIKGYPDGTVRPAGNITRAEVATIFFRLMTNEFRTENWSTENDFSDVSSSDWYNNAVSTCVKAGILQGYPDGTFRPNQSITRAEFAAIAASFASEDIPAGGMFKDIEGHWAETSIERAAAMGWIKGSNGMFRPNDNITRAEVVTTVNRMLDRIPDADHLLPEMKTFPDNTPDMWWYADVQEATNSHDYDRDEIGTTEIWTELLPEQDWTALEKEWATAADANVVDVAAGLLNKDEAEGESESEEEE